MARFGESLEFPQQVGVAAGVATVFQGVVGPPEIMHQIAAEAGQYPGGIKAEQLGVVLETAPERVLERAVRGMLPKTKLGDALFGKLKVYAGPEHPHAAQQPMTLDVASLNRKNSRTV